MENALKNFRIDKTKKNSFLISKKILRKINFFCEGNTSKILNDNFSKIFEIPKYTLENKYKKLLYNQFNYNLSKFNQTLHFKNIFNELLKSFYLFILIFFSKKNRKILNFDFIIHGIDDQRSFNRYEKLINKFNKSLVMSNVVLKKKSNITIFNNSKFQRISSNSTKKKRIKIFKLFFEILFRSFYNRFNYIFFFNRILYSILNNYTLFEKFRGKYFMEDRFYNTCSIRNYFFKKFGGKATSTPQKNIVETCISFFIDTDIFFSLGNEKYSLKRLKLFGGRVKKSLPVGSFFLEHDWFRKKKDLKLVPKNDILIMGLNPNTWLEINNTNKKNYEFTIRNWIKKIGILYPNLKIMIKHHGNLKNNEYEKKFFKKNKNITSAIANFTKNGSYGFIKKGKIIFSFGSTTTLEAISMQKQSFFLDPKLESKNFFDGLTNLNKITIRSFASFKRLLDKVLFLKEYTQFNKDIYCLKSDSVSSRVYNFYKQIK